MGGLSNLTARDTLAGTASLNWSADTPITEWNGVVLGENVGTCDRNPPCPHGSKREDTEGVGSLANLGGLSNLTGEIPPAGRPDVSVSFRNNQLTGEIPPELGGLSNLTLLYLHANQLTGEIPPELGGLSNLTYAVSPRQPVDGRDSA